MKPKEDQMNQPGDGAFLMEAVDLCSRECGELLAPIPGEQWTCVLPEKHLTEGHMAEDGTSW